MKQRIELTDSQLAIAMWLYIYLRISEHDVEDNYFDSISEIKGYFLEEHFRDDLWQGNCLLCERYFRKLPEVCACPLSEGGLDCGRGSSYWNVTRYWSTPETKEKALDSCKKIIEIMIKEHEKDEANMAEG